MISVILLSHDQIFIYILSIIFHVCVLVTWLRVHTSCGGSWGLWRVGALRVFARWDLCINVIFDYHKHTLTVGVVAYCVMLFRQLHAGLQRCYWVQCVRTLTGVHFLPHHLDGWRKKEPQIPKMPSTPHPDHHSATALRGQLFILSLSHSLYFSLFI